MSDIVERLQVPVMYHSNAEQTNAERREAANEVEQLRATLQDLLDSNVLYHHADARDKVLATLTGGKE